MKLHRTLLLLLALSTPLTPGWGQGSDVPFEPSRPVGEPVFESVLSLHQQPGAQPQLRHAEVATSDDWPGVLYAEFDSQRGKAICTAALVGPQAMLTAAHCVPVSNQLTFRFGGHEFASNCEIHPSYQHDDASADFALCKVLPDNDFPTGVVMPAGRKFDRINTDPMNGLVSGTSATLRQVVLTGYGCVSDIARHQTVDMRFRVGVSRFVDWSDNPARPRGSRVYSPRQKNNLITSEDVVYANLCPGDSGGPAYAYSSSGVREIVGVNSRVFPALNDPDSYGASLVSATGGPDFAAWARSWAHSRAQVEVCGIEGTGVLCNSL